MLALKSGIRLPSGTRGMSTAPTKPANRLKVKDHSAEMIHKYRHPWVYAAALAPKSAGSLPTYKNGSVVDLVNKRGEFVARGTYNGNSRMAVRILTYDKDEMIDSAFWRKRISAALERRRSSPALNNPKSTNAYRVINAESDLLPGLVVDKYAEWYVIQVQNAGIEAHREEIIDALAEVLKPKTANGGIYERSDEGNRQKDGLPFRKGLVYPPGGSVPGKHVEIVENGRKYLVDLVKGHKTGFYLDQRENRNIIASYCKGKDVLNCFSYTGSFAIAALQGGARSVVNVDVSADALELAKANIELNGLVAPGEAGSLVTQREANVFDFLREFGESRQAKATSSDDSNAQTSMGDVPTIAPIPSSYDVVILDPPKFSTSSDPEAIQKATRGYKDINRLAMTLLRPGGILATFSCSGSIDTTLFRQIVSSAAIEAGRPMQIIQQLNQPEDHPIGSFFPEAHYLKGFVLKAL